MKEIFTDQEKVQILADLVAIKSVNDHELQVAKYLQRLFAKYGITGGPGCGNWKRGPGPGRVRSHGRGDRWRVDPVA